MDDKIDLKNTPKFKNPPLIETVIGVQFAPLVGFQLTHYGLFQSATGREFSSIEQHPRLPHQIEERESTPPMPVFQMMPMFLMNLPRVWYRQRPKDGGEHLVQLQDDRLIVNWRKLPGTKDQHRYPSYKVGLCEFETFFKTLEKFSKDNKLGGVEVDQCEICYVNEIKTNDFASPAEAFTMIFDAYVPNHQPKNINGDIENQNFNASYWCEKLNGRLFIDAGIMTSAETGRPVVTLRLTVRGAPSGSSKQDVLDWFDLGHHYVVHTFKDITAKYMHDRWGESK